IEHKLGGVYGRRGEWGRSEARLTLALDAAPPGAQAPRPPTVADLALPLPQAGRADDAAARAAEALELADAAADRQAQGQAHNSLRILRRSRGTIDAPGPARARELTDSPLDLSAAHGDRPREAALENTLADLHHAAGRADDAMDHLKRAVAIFSEGGAGEATRRPAGWRL